MRQRKKKSVSRQILDSLRDFTKKLEQGIPIEATEVRRINTPDGPMHLRRHKVIVPRKRG